MSHQLTIPPREPQKRKRVPTTVKKGSDVYVHNSEKQRLGRTRRQSDYDPKREY